MTKARRKEKAIRCIDCIFCIPFSEEVKKALFPEYPYICAIPSFVGTEPSGTSCEALDCRMFFLTEKGAKEPTDCPYFKGYDV